MAEEFQLQSFLLELMQLMQVQSSVWLTGSSLIRYNVQCHSHALLQRSPQIFFLFFILRGGGGVGWGQLDGNPKPGGTILGHFSEGINPSFFKSKFHSKMRSLGTAYDLS